MAFDNIKFIIIVDDDHCHLMAGMVVLKTI